MTISSDFAGSIQEQENHEQVQGAPVNQTSDRKNTKRRKCTYTVRREKATALRKEVRKLESEVEVLKIRSTQSGVDGVLKQVTDTNALLNRTAKERHLHVAKAQSALSQCLGVQESYPLYTRICLPKDWEQRRAKLVAMRDTKLRNAYSFVMNPRRYVDPTKTHYSDNRFETEAGDICGVRLETVQFPGVKSLQQVYDAAVYYLTNMEISITEQLGHLTVRDDYETIDGNVYNARVLSTLQSNVVMETSSLMFTKLNLDAGYGVIALDSIDEDDLYPYTPSERVRKDISATAVFTAVKKKDELVVTMRGSAFLKIHRPQFPLSEAATEEVAGGIFMWGDVMVKAIRDIVYRSC